MNDAPLAGRRALVTGAARRTGRALALGLAQAGADVAVHYRTSRDEAEDTATRIRAVGRRATCVQADLLDPDAAQQVVAQTVEALGGLDILVNNVGQIVWKDIGELSPEDWKAGLDGTLTITWLTCRAALPVMRRQAFGRIVNILDAGADSLGPAVHATPYKIGKTGALVLTRTLAVAEAPHAITVNAISPGTLDNSEKQPPLARIPAGRVGTPDDLVAALLYLCSDGASYTTGTNIKVSGGYLI